MGDEMSNLTDREICLSERMGDEMSNLTDREICLSERKNMGGEMSNLTDREICLSGQTNMGDEKSNLTDREICLSERTNMGDDKSNLTNREICLSERMGDEMSNLADWEICLSELANMEDDKSNLTNREICLSERTNMGDEMSNLTDREICLSGQTNMGDEKSNLTDREICLSEQTNMGDDKSNLSGEKLNQSDWSVVENCLSVKTVREDSSGGRNFLSDRAEFQNYLIHRKARADGLSPWASSWKQVLKAGDEVASLKTDNETQCKQTCSDTACPNSTNECPRAAIQSDTNNDINLAMAKEERKRQGPREAEYSFGGEADLHKHHTSCEKNPEHKNFIPLDQFTVDQLPGRYREDIFYRYIKAVADLTVRVSVNYVSDRRPKTFPDSSTPYPFSVNGGTNVVVHGSGWVSDVLMCPRRYYNNVPRYCECKECRDSPTPRVKFYHIYIITAAHVVFDDFEAATTKCILFFDKGGTPGICDGAVTLSGMKHIGGDIETDWCEMRYETHDEDLANRISEMASLRNSMRKNASLKSKTLQKLEFKETKTEHGTRHVSNEDVLTVVVSHPHGCSKQISLGFCSYIDVTKDGWTQYTYTTATCPGSSGGPVFTISSRWSYHAHSGNCTENKQLNYSSHGVDMVPQHHAYIRKYRDLCKKNYEARTKKLSPGRWRKEQMVKEDDTTDVHKRLIVDVKKIGQHSEKCQNWTENTDGTQDASCVKNTNVAEDASCTEVRRCTDDTSCTEVMRCTDYTSCTEVMRCTDDTSCTKATRCTEDASCTEVMRCTDDTSCTEVMRCTDDTRCTEVMRCTDDTSCTEVMRCTDDTSCTEVMRCTDDTSCTEVMRCTDDTSCTEVMRCTDDTSCTEVMRCTDDTSCTEVMRCTDDTNCTEVTRCTDDTSCIQDTRSYTDERKYVNNVSCTEYAGCTQATNCSADTRFIHDTGCTEDTRVLQGTRSTKDKSQRKTNLISRLFGRERDTRSLLNKKKTHSVNNQNCRKQNKQKRPNENSTLTTPVSKCARFLLSFRHENSS